MDEIQDEGGLNANDLIFNLNVEALYDSLKRDQVRLAILHATAQCRPNWTGDFIDWLLIAIDMSLDAAVGMFKGRWYKSTDGVATGGKLCVYVANITVYWAFSIAIYSQKCTNIVYFFRYVDDGTGGWRGTPIQFFRWFCKIYKYLNDKFNLRLTFNLRHAYNFIEFLEVNYRFLNKLLDTDVFYKDTDAHRYLHFSSRHPPSTFKSVVYSQFLRLRRIIIDQNVLEFRINEMSEFFAASGYPRKLLNSIKLYVLNLKRDLNYKSKANEGLSGKFGAAWITTYGPGFDEVRGIVSQTNEKLKASPLFHDLTYPALGVVPRRAANLRDMLFNQKSLGLGTGIGSVTTRCTLLDAPKKRGRPCESCDLMSEESTIKIGNKILSCSGGDCKSFNCNYCVQCIQCSKPYFGKTIIPVGTRIGQHRNFITTLNTCIEAIEVDDENTLAAHALEHGIRTKSGFNSLYMVFVVRHSEKEMLTINEQNLINSYNTV